VIADLCTPVIAASPDAADAAEYAAAGDEARAAGDVRIAALAYRKAAVLGDARSAQALAELCASDGEPALHAAIGFLAHGDTDEAQAALASLDTPGAHFFRAVIALRRHEGGEAERELEIAARDPAYAAASATMLRIARRSGRLEALLFAGGEVDTNPQLVPDTPPTGATGTPTTDENAQLALTAVARPWSWLALRDAVVWRKQRTLHDFDFFGENAQVAIEDDRGPDHVAIRYDFDYDLLGGASYLVAHRGTLAYRRELGAWEAGATYSLRARDFRRATEASFDGGVHTGELAVTLHASTSIDIDGKLLGWRETTEDPLFSDWTGGAQIGVRARPRDRVRLSASAASWYSFYDGLDPNGDRRRDIHGEGNGELEVDLADHVLALAAVSAAVNESSIDDFDYRKLVVRVGLAFAIGGP
jgi:hypothetical protein